MDINTAPKSEIDETAEGFIHRISMETKGPPHPSSRRNSYIFVIRDAFTHFAKTKPTLQNDVETTADVFWKNGSSVLVHQKFCLQIKVRKVLLM